MHVGEPVRVCMRIDRLVTSMRRCSFPPGLFPVCVCRDHKVCRCACWVAGVTSMAAGRRTGILTQHVWPRRRQAPDVTQAMDEFVCNPLDAHCADVVARCTCEMGTWRCQWRAAQSDHSISGRQAIIAVLSVILMLSASKARCVSLGGDDVVFVSSSGTDDAASFGRSCARPLATIEYALASTRASSVVVIGFLSGNVRAARDVSISARADCDTTGGRGGFVCDTGQHVAVVVPKHVSVSLVNVTLRGCEAGLAHVPQGAPEDVVVSTVLLAESSIENMPVSARTASVALLADPKPGANSVQRAVLEAFYWATSGPSWKVSSGWLGNTSECEWYGVQCLAGTVSLLLLDNNNLVGSIGDVLNTLTACATALRVLYVL